MRASTWFLLILIAALCLGAFALFVVFNLQFDP